MCRRREREAIGQIQKSCDDPATEIGTGNRGPLILETTKSIWDQETVVTVF